MAVLRLDENVPPLIKAMNISRKPMHISDLFKKIAITVIVIVFTSLTAALLMFLAVIVVNNFIFTPAEIARRTMNPDFLNYFGVMLFFITATIFISKALIYLSKLSSKIHLALYFITFLSLYYSVFQFTFGIEWKDIYMYTMFIPLLIAITFAYYLENFLIEKK